MDQSLAADGRAISDRIHFRLLVHVGQIDHRLDDPLLAGTGFEEIGFQLRESGLGLLG